MENNLIIARTCVYNISYHMVWSVKYRRKVLTNPIQTRIKELAQEIGNDKGFIVHLIEIGENDHVHAFISAHPKYAISYIIKMLKGITGRKLLWEFPEITNKLWKGELWNPSYYVETIGSISEETVRHYIENQQQKRE